MKIALGSLHPRRLSGQIESLVALAQELEALGHQVRLVSAFEPESLLDSQSADPVRQERGASPLGKLACMARGLSRLASLGDEVDLIHLNLPTPAFSWLADLLARRGRPPVVVGYEAHLAEVGTLLRSGYLWRDPAFYLPLALVNNGLWGRLGAYRCQRYVVASEWQRAELLALGVDTARLVSLPNLIDRRKLVLHEPAAALRALLGPASAGPIVGWAGHFHHVKGVDVLLEAFASLRRERPTARLALAWSGIGNPAPILRQLRQLQLADSVIRLGRVEIGQFAAGLDLLVLPYRLTMGQGAYPNLVLEAMALGLPLVTSDLPLLRELVQPGETGLLTQPDNPIELATAIGRLLDDRDLAARMVAAQRALMQGRLGAATLARRYAELYGDVLADQA